jgi:hypothetical protein
MKQDKWFVPAIAMIVCLLCQVQPAAGQAPEFVPGDDNYSLLLAFHRTDTILVVTPAGFDLTASDRELIEAFPFWGDFRKIPYYRYVKEPDLKAADLTGRIQYYGPFNMFRNACVPGMPFRAHRDGFVFGGSLCSDQGSSPCGHHTDSLHNHTDHTPDTLPGYGLYNEPGDAFFWLSDDTTRLFTCSNAGHEFSQYRTYMAGYYQLYIFRGDDLHISGFTPVPSPEPLSLQAPAPSPAQAPASESAAAPAPGPGTLAGTARLNYLPGLREEYFTSFHSTHFDFKIASSLDIDSMRTIIIREADSFVDTMLHRLGTTDTVSRRIQTYIYANRTDLQKFIAAPSWTTVYGKASGDVNHLSAFDPALFRHEAAHSLISQVAGINPYCFFSEGFAVSMEYFFSPGSLESDLKTAYAGAGLLTEELVYGTTTRFYSIPAAYQVAGVFTRYLIDLLGIKVFIRAYSDNTIEDCLKEKTGLDMEQTIIRWKNASGY